MTDKLYYESSHRKDFEAQVISCEPEGEGYKVVLDKTVFFPEGGGQYADTGILGGVHVLDAQEKDGIIYHYTDGALTPGEIVKGEIDWERDSKVCSNIAASISFQELYMEDSDTTM